MPRAHDPCGCCPHRYVEHGKNGKCYGVVADDRAVVKNCPCPGFKPYAEGA